MSYEGEFTSISIRVPKTFREQYVKPQEFWKEIGEFFVNAAGCLTKAELNQLKLNYPNVIKFIEEMLPDA